MIQRVEEYRAKSLSLNMLYADFKIAFNKQNVIVVKISGDEEMKNAVSFSMSEGLLKVEGKLPGVEIDPSNISISISNDTIKINGTKLDKGKKLLIELSLPWNVELDVREYALGTMSFTTDAGDVVLRNSGFMTIEAKSFNKITTYISGMGDLVIDDVANGLTADVSSSGDLTARTVKGGLSVTVSGSGDVEISELDGSLTANLRDMGDLVIDRVSVTTGNFTITGSGDVEIGDGKIQDLTVNTTDMGGFVFEGHAVTGSFICSGMGDIEVDSCDNVTKQKATGMGDIEIG